MRVGLFLLGLAMGLPANAPAQPDPVLYSATVTQAEALVRCGPGETAQFYPTNALKRGAVVQVLKVVGNGWLQIAPPAGSYSWINMRFVSKLTSNQPNYVVKAGQNVKVPVLIGSDANGNVKPTVEGAKLGRGAQVVAVGPPISEDDGMWLKIDPPPGEYRYIRAEAVTRTDGASPAVPVAGVSPFNTARPETTTSASNPPGASDTLSIPGGNQQPAAASGRISQLYAQAVQAERAGNIPQAILLYQQVGSEGHATQRDLAMQSLDRAYWLGRGSKTQTVQGQPTRTLPTQLPDSTGSRFTPTNPQTNPQTNPEPVTQTSSRQAAVGGYPFSTGAGILRGASRVLDGRKTYLMVTRDGLMIAYVTPGPGIDLDPYVNREVEMIGQAVYRGDLKTNYMVVERVQLGR